MEWCCVPARSGKAQRQFSHARPKRSTAWNVGGYSIVIGRNNQRHLHRPSPSPSQGCRFNCRLGVLYSSILQTCAEVQLLNYQQKSVCFLDLLCGLRLSCFDPTLRKCGNALLRRDDSEVKIKVEVETVPRQR